MEPIVLVRERLMTRYERTYATAHFEITTSRVLCRDRLVIGRYSVTPHYDELVEDLALLGSRLVNSLAEHRWITSFAWYDALQDFTPQTWSEDEFAICAADGPFVVRGRQHSKKWNWQTHMYAANKRAALRVAQRLKEDGDLQEQGVVFRRYVPLRTFEVIRNGLPVTNEWRFYYYRTERLGYGYYWSISDAHASAQVSSGAVALADQIAAIAARFATFFTLDLAETSTGDWILIELNDGQMASPGEHDWDQLYRHLRRCCTATC